MRVGLEEAVLQDHLGDDQGGAICDRVVVEPGFV
jgi:hypothetical protein